jgi:hypothetical protein
MLFRGRYGLEIAENAGGSSHYAKEIDVPASIQNATTPEGRIQAIYSDIRGLSNERAYVLNNKGDIVLALDGGKSSINLTDAQTKILEKLGKNGGGLYIHNHPGGKPLSAKDWEALSRYNLSMQAVTPGGRVYGVGPGQGGVISSQIKGGMAEGIMYDLLKPGLSRRLGSPSFIEDSVAREIMALSLADEFNLFYYDFQLP